MLSRTDTPGHASVAYLCRFRYLWQARCCRSGPLVLPTRPGFRQKQTDTHALSCLPRDPSTMRYTVRPMSAMSFPACPCRTSPTSQRCRTPICATSIFLSCPAQLRSLRLRRFRLQVCASPCHSRCLTALSAFARSFRRSEGHARSLLPDPAALFAAFPALYGALQYLQRRFLPRSRRPPD